MMQAVGFTDLNHRQGLAYTATSQHGEGAKSRERACR